MSSSLPHRRVAHHPPEGQLLLATANGSSASASASASASTSNSISSNGNGINSNSNASLKRRKKLRMTTKAWLTSRWNQWRQATSSWVAYSRACPFQAALWTASALMLVGILLLVWDRQSTSQGRLRLWQQLSLQQLHVNWHRRASTTTNNKHQEVKQHNPFHYNDNENNNKAAAAKAAAADEQREHSSDHIITVPKDMLLKYAYMGPPPDDPDFPPRTPSSVYSIPHALPHIGDKTDEYAQLRKDFDELFPPGNFKRSLAAVESLRLRTYEPFPMTPMEPLPDDGQPPNAIPYDIYNCPETPPTNYPYTWNLVDDILHNWPPDDPTPRSNIYQSFCVFDYIKDYDKALAYRDAELPFVVKNDPEAAEATERWNTPGFMEALMGDVKHRCEYSANNHFMYWVPPPPAKSLKHRHLRNKNNGKNLDSPMDMLKDWKEPTKLMRMAYTEWVKHANVTDDKLGPDKPHWYYRLIGCGEMGEDCDMGNSEYLFDELLFFQPRPHQLYLTDHKEQKGIHCRFGMKGVIAENHFDGSRNAIALMGGERRYILAHPNQCPYLALYQPPHPSSRHSAVDWSDPDLEKFPEFAKARANEVVLQAGDVMYLPTNWFHYIISLELNYQCNTRSGISYEYHPPIKKCGF